MTHMLFNWAEDTFASEDIIDLYFILSDLKDIELSEAEIAEIRHYDSRCAHSVQGYTVENHHVYDADGNDLGPVGRFVV